MSVVQNTYNFDTHETLSTTYFSSAVPYPLMLERLADIDIIVLDAAVASGPLGERAKRLLENRRNMHPHHSFKLLITAHSDGEQQIAQTVTESLQHLVDSVETIVESGRNETAINALRLHRKHWPDT